MNERINPETGEVTNLPATVNITMATAIAKAELDTRITTARAFPRSTQTSVQDILSLATLNEKTAETMIYALPRGNKPILGPSIRLAEIVSQCWGNCISESRVVAIDRINKIITAEGLFTDLQTNSTVKATAERRISDKHGRLYSDDMITVTGNAARSIARRNAILAGVPKAVWEQAYNEAERLIAGDVASLAVTREKAVKAFAVFGLKPEQVFKLIDVKGEQDIGITEVLALRAMFASIKNGETTVEELLTESARGSTNFDRVANPLQDEERRVVGNVSKAAHQPKARSPSKTTPEPTPASAAEGEPTAADKPTADQGGGAQSPREATVADETRQSDATSEDSAATTDPVTIAHQRGIAARAAGHPRKALPLEYRNNAERAAEADAWHAGFDGKPIKGLL